MSDPVREELKGFSEPAKVEGVLGAAAGSSEAGAAKRQPAKPGVVLPARSGQKRGLRRAIGFIRSAAPVLQKVLPLLDGNVVSAVSNVLGSGIGASQVNLEPIENAMTKMRKDHVDLRLNVADQTAALKRIADQVATMKEMTERNSLEQKGLARDLQSLRAKISLVAWIGLGLLVVSIAVNVLLYLRVQQLVR